LQRYQADDGVANFVFSFTLSLIVDRITRPDTLQH